MMGPFGESLHYRYRMSTIGITILKPILIYENT
jgi:hypothetical protein